MIKAKHIRNSKNKGDIFNISKQNNDSTAQKIQLHHNNIPSILLQNYRILSTENAPDMH